MGLRCNAPDEVYQRLNGVWQTGIAGPSGQTGLTGLRFEPPPPVVTAFFADAGIAEWSAGFGSATGSTVAPEFDGNAGALEWSTEFGTATGTTTAPDVPAIDVNAGMLEWSAEFGTATGTTVAPDAPEFDGNAATLEWSVSFGSATGFTVAPDAIEFDGSAGTLEWSAAFGSATGTAGAPVVLLVLADSDDTGLDVVAKALLVASAPGTERKRFLPLTQTGAAPILRWTASLALVPITLSSAGSSGAAKHELALNDNNNPASFNLGAYFTSGGDGEDLTLYFQTLTDGEISFSASAQFASGGGNFVRFTLPADAQDLLDNIDTGDRFIFKAARPAAGDPFDGDAGTLEWSAWFWHSDRDNDSTRRDGIRRRCGRA